VHLSLDSHEPAPPAGLPLYRQPDLRVFIADDEWPPELPGAGLLQALVEGLS
jgi:hypothetical protein